MLTGKFIYLFIWINKAICLFRKNSINEVPIDSGIIYGPISKELHDLVERIKKEGVPLGLDMKKLNKERDRSRKRYHELVRASAKSVAKCKWVIKGSPC